MFSRKRIRNGSSIATLIGLAAAALAGCAELPIGNSGASARDSAAEIAAQRAEIARQKAELEQERAQFAAERQAAIEREAAPVEAAEATADISIDPEDAKPGECYAHVFIPALYKTTTERVMTKPESERIEITPARYETVEERVLVKPETTRTEVIPARYETVEEQVEIKPASMRREVVPAEYETVEEQVEIKPQGTKTIEVPAKYETVIEEKLIAPARTEWRFESEIEASTTAGLASASQTIERFGNYKVLDTRVETTGELMCLVEIPAQYKKIEKQVLVSDARTETVPDETKPAEYKTVRKTVLRKPETVREIPIPPEYGTVEVTRLVQPEETREIVVPAEYRTVSFTRLVEPAQERRIVIPAEYTDVTSTSLVYKERFGWRPVLCKVNMTRENVSALQNALTATGCCRCGPSRNECKADGIMGPCTFEAAQCFAKSKNLAWGSNFITLDVISELGLEF